MAEKNILVKGACEHNLKNIDVTVPRDKLVVITGLSGSGKSSLAFDTIYAEGQRRYVESLSSYARQFLGQMEKPAVDYIEGLSPAVSIDQKTTSKNPRSTVGTVTEIYDYLRLLYARVGLPHCPKCGRPITHQTVDQIVSHVLSMGEGTKIQLMAPVVRARKGEHVKELESARKNGYVRVRVDGEMRDLSEEINLEKNKKHTIEIVVDRLVIGPEIRSRLSGSIETTSALSGGLVLISVAGGKDVLFSQNYACPEHGTSIDELTPRMFSFNNPYGACPKCTGLGAFMRVDPDLVIPNRDLTLSQGAVRASGWTMEGNSIAYMYFSALAREYGFSLDVPVKNLPEEALDLVLYGTKGKKMRLERVSQNASFSYNGAFEGVIPNLERRYAQTQSSSMKEDISGYMQGVSCDECCGRRLSSLSLSVTVGGINISQLCDMPISQALKFIQGLVLPPKETIIAKEILKEIGSRLGFLCSVGLEYLTLSRSSGTLSGGESQRIRLATQIGASLMGVLYILDEPSIGLHQCDNEKLIGTLRHLRDLGNTVIVVEHDEDTMYAADHIIDIGPGAGEKGGEVVCAGTVEDIKACEKSLTGDYLSGRKAVPVPKKRRVGSGQFLEIFAANENNLKNIDVRIPMGTVTCVTGVSGSGKSTLVNEIIYKALASELNGTKCKPGKHREILGVEYFDKVVEIDQAPIGRTPRSNPATYTGLFTEIRELYASCQDAKLKGFKSNRFSFNVKGGRCEACQGDGLLKIEMHFLPSVYVPCEVCEGRRYSKETLEVKYRGKSIYDVLEMTVEEARVFFENVPKVARRLKLLSEVGLGYVRLGQPATTLSGGEAQRVKLATELSKRPTGRTAYILDEPTTGLHVADVHKLIEILQLLADNGNTVLVIEHNLDLIKTADFIIDLGPAGGDKGGSIVACGTPETVAREKNSQTGKYLKKMLKK